MRDTVAPNFNSGVENGCGVSSMLCGPKTCSYVTGH